RCSSEPADTPTARGVPSSAASSAAWTSSRRSRRRRPDSAARTARSRWTRRSPSSRPIAASGCQDVPELPEVESVRRRLEPAMTNRRFDRVIVRRPDLRAPFPRRFAARLTGQTVLAVERRAKYLVLPLSSRETLLMHLGMSGWFDVSGAHDAPRHGRHDPVGFYMSSGGVGTL